MRIQSPFSAQWTVQRMNMYARILYRTSYAWKLLVKWIREQERGKGGRWKKKKEREREKHESIISSHIRHLVLNVVRFSLIEITWCTSFTMRHVKHRIQLMLKINFAIGKKVQVFQRAYKRILLASLVSPK